MRYVRALVLSQLKGSSIADFSAVMCSSQAHRYNVRGRCVPSHLSRATSEVIGCAARRKIATATCVPATGCSLQISRVWKSRFGISGRQGKGKSCTGLVDRWTRGYIYPVGGLPGRVRQWAVPALYPLVPGCIFRYLHAWHVVGHEVQN